MSCSFILYEFYQRTFLSCDPLQVAVSASTSCLISLNKCLKASSQLVNGACGYYTMLSVQNLYYAQE